MVTTDAFLEVELEDLARSSSAGLKEDPFYLGGRVIVGMKTVIMRCGGLCRLDPNRNSL